MDDPSRTFQRAEEKFFSECNTGHGELVTSMSLGLGLNVDASVPVIAVFTKFDALRPVAFGEIKQQLSLSREEQISKIPQHAEEIFTRTRVWDRLCDAKNLARPKDCVRLQSKLPSFVLCIKVAVCRPRYEQGQCQL